MPVINGYYLSLGLLIVCTVVGITVAARFRREVDEDLAPTTPRDLLDPLEKAYSSGLMRPEEIERVRASVRKGKLPPGPAEDGKRSSFRGEPDGLDEQIPGDAPVGPEA